MLLELVFAVVLVLVLLWYFDKLPKGEALMVTDTTRSARQIALGESLAAAPLSAPIAGAPLVVPKTASTMGPGAVERSALADNVNFYSQPCTNACDGDLSFATNDFGAPGADFKDYLTSQAVDNSVIANHAEFVRDRQKFGNVTGRTYSPDSHDSYDPTPWIGIRGRPQNVPFGNPDQVPDVDFSLYADKQRVTWST